MVRDLVPGRVIRYEDGAGLEKRCYRITCQKLEKTLPAYQPTWTLETGIKELRDAYSDFALTKEAFTGSDFLRIRRISGLIEDGQLDDNLRWINNAQKERRTSIFCHESKDRAMYQSIDHCRSCDGTTLHEVLSLGDVPLADKFLSVAGLSQPEPRFPLNVVFCGDCSLVQIRETVQPEILFDDDYPYFSSFLPAWVEHCRLNVE
jgi:hypothetical protein